MAAFNTEQFLSVHHWNDSLFSFKTTRDPALRFHNGHFVMLGLEVNGKPLMRAYSIASANYEENLEFLSIKVQDGRSEEHTSELQSLMRISYAVFCLKKKKKKHKTKKHHLHI